ncbi:MAG: hypothetical protein K2O32_13145 [Acetatifactor sp.]|nr:hypothetical protein [Acetatifactor sp.]
MKEAPIWKRTNITIKKATEYSNIGNNRIEELFTFESWYAILSMLSSLSIWCQGSFLKGAFTMGKDLKGN